MIFPGGGFGSNIESEMVNESNIVNFMEFDCGLMVTTPIWLFCQKVGKIFCKKKKKKKILVFFFFPPPANF